METINLFLLSTFTNEEKNFFERKLKKFEKKHNVEVYISRASWSNAYSRLIKNFKTGNSPDVFQLGTTWVKTFSHLGYLSRVPDFVLCPALTKWMNNCCREGNDWVAQPWIIDIRSLMVNGEILNSAGFSYSDLKSINHFSQICKSLAKEKERGNITASPFTFTIRRIPDLLHRFVCWHWAMGKEFPLLKTGREVYLSKESCVETLEFIINLVEASKLSEEEIKSHPYRNYEGFRTRGEYVFFHGAWEPRFGDDENDFDYEALPMPISGSDYYYWGGGSVLAVSSAARKKDLCWQLVRFLISDKIMEPWVKICLSLPAFNCDFWNKYIHIENIRKARRQIVRSASYQNHPLWSVIEKCLYTGISYYYWNRIIENKDKEEAYSFLKNADKEVNKLLEYNWSKEVW